MIWGSWREPSRSCGKTSRTSWRRPRWRRDTKAEEDKIDAKQKEIDQLRADLAAHMDEMQEMRKSIGEDNRKLATQEDLEKHGADHQGLKEKFEVRAENEENKKEIDSWRIRPRRVTRMVSRWRSSGTSQWTQSWCRRHEGQIAGCCWQGRWHSMFWIFEILHWTNQNAQSLKSGIMWVFL